MNIGFIGLGRMGLNMTRRLLRSGHSVVGLDRSAAAVEEAARAGAIPAPDLQELTRALAPPRVVWAMIPAGAPVDELIGNITPLLQPGDVLVDGGNSNYKDTQRRARQLESGGIHLVDAGTSGGIWGLELGYCIMAGGKAEAIALLAPAFESLAPPRGWLHVGREGAGHFAKMIHNGIEYGMMQAYAEGFDILQASSYGYDLQKVAHLWNQGSVVRSWLLELAERAFEEDPQLEKLRGYVDDSGEGRWTVQEAVDLAVPAPVLALSLFARFRSRREDSFADRMLAALRNEFGGHAVKSR
ncbi:MAG TPA: decarboxylating 6-phosphogluconate dehydrogenase [Candidatus Limnocylindrales bacterium]|nr:decarboxylating 6-phosphogluconate dehydrogenase [Candidatus Limnocylindrales bacterium]